ncbi:hypothetical protein G7Z17_g12688 [Cylindrodendrum hubeiense]|uniref:EVE domain-containing protein n=1 Tax=Cylindrodendrum hubeiense TaxID=595255 RepID=A0A9P5GX82_9HYPO|nr:hypothetical protein G7Z17_g12688 [Cylindrodendrum hubeiense]
MMGFDELIDGFVENPGEPRLADAVRRFLRSKHDEMLQATAHAKAEAEKAREEAELASQPRKALEALAKSVELLPNILETLKQVATDPEPQRERQAIQRAVGELETLSLTVNMAKLAYAVVPSLERLSARVEELPTCNDVDCSVERVGGFLADHLDTLNGAMNESANRVGRGVVEMVVKVADEVKGTVVDATTGVTKAVNDGADRVGQTIAEAAEGITKSVADSVDQTLTKAVDHVEQAVGNGIHQVGGTMATACGDVKEAVVQANGFVMDSIKAVDTSVSSVKDAVKAIDTSVSVVKDAVTAANLSNVELNAMLTTKLTQVLTQTEGQRMASNLAAVATQTENLRKEVKESHNAVIASIGNLPGVDDIAEAVSTRANTMYAGLSTMAMNHKDLTAQMEGLRLQLEHLEKNAVGEHMAAKAAFEAATEANKAQLEQKTRQLDDRLAHVGAENASNFLSLEREHEGKMQIQQTEHANSLLVEMQKHERARLVLQQEYHTERVRLTQLTETLRRERDDEKQALNGAKEELELLAEKLNAANRRISEMELENHLQAKYMADEAQAHSELVDEMQFNADGQVALIADMTMKAQELTKAYNGMDTKTRDQASLIQSMQDEAEELTNAFNGMDIKARDQAALIQSMQDQAQAQNGLVEDMKSEAEGQAIRIAELNKSCQEAASFRAEYQLMEREKDEALAKLQAMQAPQLTPRKTQSSGSAVGRLSDYFADLWQTDIEAPRSRGQVVAELWLNSTRSNASQQRPFPHPLVTIARGNFKINNSIAMPPRKRNATALDSTVEEPIPKRRSLRSATRSQAAEPSLRSQVQTEGDAVIPDSKSPAKSQKKTAKASTKTAKSTKTASPARPTKQTKPTKRAQRNASDKIAKTEKAVKSNATKSSRGVSEGPDIDSIPAQNPDAPKHDGEWYWLMKAEPETRMENGIDVRFSIDDLRAKEKPEGWDARNNMRNMNAGDKAFFYHSNCKEPAIVGTARQPGTPYYDPSSTKDKPKWDLVHVEFRKKFAVKIGLKELRELGKPGGPLENMQMLKQSRLSVSKVSGAEFEALCELADKKAKDAGLEHEV